eukprot:365404_1
MSANKPTTKFVHLTSCPNTGYITVPTGIDKNNYIVIDTDIYHRKINCVHKYDVDNDKWIKIDGLNNIENMSYFSATLDVNKQILFLSRMNYITQIELNSHSIKNDTHNAMIQFPYTPKSIIVDNSLFVIGGRGNNSILKWNSQNKTLTKFSEMYNKMKIGSFGMICENDRLLLFGGYSPSSNGCVDYILEFNIKTKTWNKIHVSFPKPIRLIECTMAINNKYVLIFGGYSSDWNNCDDIYIYSLKNKTIK